MCVCVCVCVGGGGKHDAVLVRERVNQLSRPAPNRAILGVVRLIERKRDTHFILKGRSKLPH